MQPAAPSLTIAPIEPYEVADWLAWRREVITTVFGPQDETLMTAILAENERYLEQALMDGEHLAVFAMLGDIRVGCGSVCFQRELPSPDNPGGQCAYLMNIYVRPEYRRRGIARVIVGWLVDQAKIRGITKIYLESTIDAKPLYRALGFVDMPDYMIFAGAQRAGSSSPLSEGQAFGAMPQQAPMAAMGGMGAAMAPQAMGAAMAPMSGSMMPPSAVQPQPMGGVQNPGAPTPMASAWPQAAPYPGMPQQWRNAVDATAAMPAISNNPLAVGAPDVSRAPNSAQQLSYLVDGDEGDSGDKKPLSAMALISFILSLIGALSAAVPFVGIESYLTFIDGNEWIFLVAAAAIGVLAIIFGIIGLVKTNNGRVSGRGLALAGVVVGAIAVVLVGTLWGMALSQPTLFDFDVSGFYSFT